MENPQEVSVPYTEEFRQEVRDFVNGKMQFESYDMAVEKTRDLLDQADKAILESKGSLRDRTQLLDLLNISLNQYVRES